VTCSVCSFPFTATDTEKSKFIGQYIFRKGVIKDTDTTIKRVRILLWSIGIFNIVFPYIAFSNDPDLNYIASLYIIWGVIFIGFGFLTYKKPLISVLIPLIIPILFNVYIAIVEPLLIFRWKIWRSAIIGVLLYSLISIIKAEKIRRLQTV
jgi:hypothetical protein